MGIFQNPDNYDLQKLQPQNAIDGNTSNAWRKFLNSFSKNDTAELESDRRKLSAIYDAIDHSQALIEFMPDGTVINANKNFLDLTGYKLDEIVGEHHSIFVKAADRNSQNYTDFWARLRRGEYDAGEYLRIGNGGKQVWIQASYNPVFDETGAVEKVVKFASDITDRKLRDADNLGKIDAIDKSQAVIEFEPDGTIITANQIFLDLLEYDLESIRGKHHRTFMPSGETEKTAYKQFWEDLNRGEFQAGVFKRIGKNGKVLWINATYTPMLDPDGKVFKVVKFASDITEEKMRDVDNSGKISAIDKSQAIIEFKTDGTILHANDNFLQTLGYSLSEIRGRHHSLFVEPSYKASPEYSDFWKKLNRGEFDSGEYLRLGKNGKEVWIQASYNPIKDEDGKVLKVVKFATDITEQKALQKMIASTLADTSEVMESLSEGDLSVKMNGVYTGEFATLAQKINDYIDNLREIVSSIMQSASAVRTGANEIAQGNMNLSQRTEEQAASLEETSSAMEEMTTTVQSNTENSTEANKLAQSARQVAEQGGVVVGQAVTAMQEINESSDQIGAIISVIDEIAFQTNLLALNAAVEAARAGDQGRGFAVVADEVRELAGRSATAAKEIKELIHDSHNKVSEGSRLINSSGDNLNGIVEEVKKVNAIVGEITLSSEEQATGLIEINRAVHEMDQMTQQNAALVEQAAAASESLDGQAENLDKLVSFFSL